MDAFTVMISLQLLLTFRCLLSKMVTPLQLLVQKGPNLKNLNFTKLKSEKKTSKASVLKKNRAKKNFAHIVQPQLKPDFPFSQDLIKT
jgi:hypothetical protein